MPISDEMRRLQAKWEAGTGWPKRLEWVCPRGLRGWEGQRFEFPFPIMAVVGENGSGKSTILQCAASVYRPSSGSARRSQFPSDFFPDTAWDTVEDAVIEYQVRQGSETITESLRKPTSRWRGHGTRPQRDVEYVDLSRIQPIPSRHGYSQLSNPTLTEVSADPFDRGDLARLGQIMGREYGLARMALTEASHERAVLVLDHRGSYSGFHGGAGETTVSELLKIRIPDYALVIIDEIETSLHPRTQRRMMRDLAALCRQRQLQIILSTHSPYILEELPTLARAFIILPGDGNRNVVYGVSPEFAMTKMDDVPQFECDLYVEDERAKAVLTEILVTKAPDLVQRVRLVAYGAASVGKSLGQMVAEDRFPIPSRVFLDGDIGGAPGCLNLPGEDAPERVVMEALRDANWLGAADRTGRPFADFSDACVRAMTLTDHHEWIRQAATDLVLGGDILWQALCAEWAENCLDETVALALVRSVRDAVDRLPQREASPISIAPVIEENEPEPGPEPDVTPASSSSDSSTERLPLFEQ